MAIVLGREALDLHPQGHPDQSMFLKNLGSCLYFRHERLGAVEDLDEVIVVFREALNLRPQGHPDRSVSLNNLADGLSSQYSQLGAIADLEEAIIFNREALFARKDTLVGLCP